MEHSESLLSSIPAHIQKPCHIYEKSYILCNPGNSEPWHTESLGYSENQIYLKLDTYSEPSQKFKMVYFAKIIKSYNYFSKAPYLRSLTWF